MHPTIVQALRAAAPAPGRVSRRSVLQSGAGLVLAVRFAADAQAATPAAVGATATGPLAPNAFVRIGTDGLVTVVCKHHEMGQGNTTGLASLVAEELDADWAQVRTEYAPSDAKRYANLAFGDLQGTGGSSAIANAYLQMRNAGATARAMLVAAAAEAWRVPPAEIRVQKGVLTHPSGKRATFGEMAAAAARQTPPATPVLKTSAQWSLLGKERATPRVDSASKCDGSAVYTIDVKLPNLHTAVIAWPPSFGAQLVSFDAAAAKRVPGVTDVVQVPEGVAVVGIGMWAALQGRNALSLRWDESRSSALDSEAVLADYRKTAAGSGGVPFAKAKPGAPAPKPVAKTIDATYEFPFLAHATMEPMNCVAWFHDGLLETWSGHQFPSFDHMLAAKAAGLPTEKVVLHTLVSGGSFGRRANAYSDFTVAAVNVAKAIGRPVPVRLQFTREDDMSQGFYRPAHVHVARIGLDGDGGIASWQHTVVGQSIVAGTPMAMMMKDGVDPTSVEGIQPTIYALPMLQGTLHMPELPVEPLWWRSVGHTHTAFVMETLIDELAAATGKDPVAYRLSLLADSPRAAGALRLAAAKGGWGRPTRAGVAQGIAVHESFGSFCAQLVEVSMPGGKVKVERVVVAIDCGVAVNPDVVRAQMEGCVGYALGALLHSEVRIQGGRAVNANFDGYPSLRIHEMPTVEVHIVPSAADPTGVGEPGVPPLAPAVANAVSKLTGSRVRRLPLARAGLVAA